MIVQPYGLSNPVINQPLGCLSILYAAIIKYASPQRDALLLPNDSPKVDLTYSFYNHVVLALLRYGLDARWHRNRRYLYQSGLAWLA